MKTSRNFSWRNIVIAAGLAAYVAVGTSSFMQKNNTFDEEYHLARGMVPLKTGDFSMNQYHPPLINVLAALPNAFNPKVKIPADYKTHPHVGYFSWDFLWRNTEDAEKILYPGRFMMLLLGALLAMLVYRWSRDLYGHRAGLLSFALALLSPNLMAHARLVTTDIGVTCFMFLSAYTLWRWMKKKTLKNLLIAGAALGCAQLSKYTALVLYPLYGLLIFADALLDDRAERPWTSHAIDSLKGAIKPFLVLAFLSLGVTVIGYGFQPATYFQKLFLFSKNATEELHFYFLGQVMNSGLWYMPLAVFAMKTPIPTLLAIVCAMFVRTDGNKKMRDHVMLFGIPVIMIAVAMIAKKNTELRYILPVFPFLFVFSGRLIFFLKSWFRIAFIGTVIAWSAFENYTIYPHYLAYFNQAVGGPANGHKYVVNSNLDWGQDLKGLATFMKKEGIDEIGLCYFGMGDPRYYGIDFIRLPCASSASPYTSLIHYDEVPVSEWPPKGWIAVSAGFFTGAYLPPFLRKMFEPLKSVEPYAVIGHTIFVYRVIRAELP
ncbi:MAG: glycosyltransferase family 39 protein [Candidatus Omnitrophota bacterium]|nr:glycosyltransferase family 39 protein [Candidatus Omnitrophota bacterium]